MAWTDEVEQGVTYVQALPPRPHFRLSLECFKTASELIAHLSRHAVATNLPEHERIGVEQPVPTVVGEAANQLGLGGHTGGATRVKGAGPRRGSCSIPFRLSRARWTVRSPWTCSICRWQGRCSRCPRCGTTTAKVGHSTWKTDGMREKEWWHGESFVGSRYTAILFPHNLVLVHKCKTPY